LRVGIVVLAGVHWIARLIFNLQLADEFDAPPSAVEKDVASSTGHRNQSFSSDSG
jgi:hypothetical protein